MSYFCFHIIRASGDSCVFCLHLTKPNCCICYFNNSNCIRMFGETLPHNRTFNSLHDLQRHVTILQYDWVLTTYHRVSPTAQSTLNQFRLRLYWQRGYYWQESRREMYWCMQCSGRCGENDAVYVDYCELHFFVTFLHGHIKYSLRDPHASNFPLVWLLSVTKAARRVASSLLPLAIPYVP